MINERNLLSLYQDRSVLLVTCRHGFQTSSWFKPLQAVQTVRVEKFLGEARAYDLQGPSNNHAASTDVTSIVADLSSETQPLLPSMMGY